MSHSRADQPRAETKALARSRQRAAGALIGGSDIPAAGQVALLKSLCRHMWALLDRRAGAEGSAETDALWCDLSVDARAAVDRTFEAAMILLARDRIYVEPTRRILDRQLQPPFSFLLVFPGGDKRVVSEDELLIMAGLA